MKTDMFSLSVNNAFKQKPMQCVAKRSCCCTQC